ncbi:response regulator transcription factor [Cohnella silvisoli]|uniref:Response regulator n=1 Tax=Cohnella silvisoli TaxID=2873699 RepID=A0ABV1L3M8_9BACL|nr:response regulator [Cohnella silvisoli]MCD9025712.1 response regulator [Cohnella silvisoli]
MRTILIVDDERMEREGIRHLIEAYKLPLIVQLRSNGNEALDLLRQQRFDILLTDIKMPFMNGLELARNARELSPGMKIIIFSAYGEFDYAVQAIHLQVVHYLLKPVVLEDFLSVVNEVITQCEEEEIRHSREADLLEGYEQVQRYEQDKALLDLLNGAASDQTRQTLSEAARERITLPLYMALIDYRTSLFISCDEAFRKLMRAAFGDDAYYLNLNEYQSVLFIKAAVHERQPDGWRPMWQRLKDRITEVFGELVFLTVGGKLHSWESARVELQRLEQLSEYKFFCDQSFVAYADDGEHALPILQGNDEPIEQTVLNVYAQIQQGGKERIEDALESLFDRFKYQSGYSNVYVKYTCTEIVKRLRSGEDYRGKAQFNLYVNELFQSQTLQQLRSVVFRAFFASSENSGDPDRESDKRAINLILNIVHAQYQNDICLDTVAEQIYLSPRYVSAIFKKEMGESFVKYLTEYRLSRARQYLRETNMKIKDIAEKVGYTDTSYFGMIFRRRFGMSPVKYREGRGQ